MSARTLVFSQLLLEAIGRVVKEEMGGAGEGCGSSPASGLI